jgi:UrcA family protein
MKTVTAIATAALLALAAGVVSAQAQDEVRTASVSYADLDLTHASGRAVLQRRVAHAVDLVCSPRPSTRELGKMQAFRACREKAWTGANQQLAQIYGGKMLAEASVKVPKGN